jgi:L-rhamnose-H+ transport protein
MSLLHRTGSSWVFTGIAVASAGILVSGVAGKLRDLDHASRLTPGARSQADLKLGLFFAVVAGLLSAVFGVALAAGQPIADVAANHGAGRLQGNIILPFACGGAFASTAIICLYLHWKEDSLREYISFADGPARSLLAANLGWATLTGFLWYGQFFFYEIAHTYMGAFKFTSWALHMAMLVVFSVGLGIFLNEWDGCRRRTILTLGAAVTVLLGAVASITYGSYLGGG